PPWALDQRRFLRVNPRICSGSRERRSRIPSRSRERYASRKRYGSDTATTQVLGSSKSTNHTQGLLCIGRAFRPRYPDSGPNRGPCEQLLAIPLLFFLMEKKRAIQFRHAT